MNGYVYPDGPYAVGSRCYAPIIEFFNGCADSITVRYTTNLHGEEQPENCLHVPSKVYTLLTGILPASGDLSSSITVEDACGNSECYTLEHDPVHGYHLRCIDDREEAILKVRISRTPYAPQFCGCHVPVWKDTVIVPVKVSKTTVQ